MNRPTSMQVMGAAVALSFVVGAGGLASGYVEAHSQAHAVLVAEQHEQAMQKASQQAAGAAISRKLCITFGKLAANKPPSGDPATNPARRYEQDNAAILAELGPDLGLKCG